MNDDSAKAQSAIVEHSTCLACGCLCDDIRVVVEENRIIEAENACSLGRPWFLSPGPGEGQPVATMDGQPAALEEAVEQAANILRAARAPVFWGLSGTTMESVASTLAIADRMGAVIDVAGSAEASARLAAFQRVGLVSASLGEVKDRADVIVFWGVDPLVTHPRHWERYSVAPQGRFIPEGRAGRFVIVVGAEPSQTSRAADLFIRIDPDRQTEAIEILRSLIRGVALDPDRAARSARVPLASLEELAKRLEGARYGALFWGPSLAAPAVEPLFRLVRDLNEHRRFVALELGGAGNRAGASAVLSWQAGAPEALDFGLGYPRHLPGEATLLDRIGHGEVDVVVIMSDLPGELRTIDRLLEGRNDVALIVIAPGAAVGWTRAPAVAINVARPGIEGGGTVARVDGVMLPLRPAIASGLPTDREILDAIGIRLRRLV